MFQAAAVGQGAGGGLDLGQGRHRHPARLGQFAAIGGDHAGPAIGAVIAALGIDDDRHLGGAGAGDQLLRDPRGEHAFAVIGQHQGLGLAEIGGRPFNDFGLVAGGDLVSGFLVAAQDLLGAGDKTGLNRGRSVGDGLHMAFDGGFLTQ